MKIAHKQYVFAFCLFLFLGFPLFAQDENAIFVIESAEFEIKGRTRPFALIRNGEFKFGEEVTGLKALEKYIADKQQILLNQRVLSKVTIEYTVGPAAEDGRYPVKLIIKVEDTWNIIAVPYPKYDSNSGFELTIKARDYNFFGTMNPLRFDLGYTYDENERNAFIFELTSDTPFTAFGYDWNFAFNHTLEYRPDAEEKFYYKNLTGISMLLPFKRTTFRFGFEESVILNEENDDKYHDEYGEFQHGVYMISKPYISWRIPTGLDIGDFGELTYQPEISASFAHDFPQMPLADFRLGPSMSFSHSLGFNRVDWIGNYRKGFDVSANNSYSFNFHQLSKNTESPQDALSLNYSISGIGHFIISDSFGVSAYLQYRHWFTHNPEYNDSAGDVLRGIFNSAVHADYMLSLNLDFPIRAFRFFPSRWAISNKPGFLGWLLRKLDFELHVSPIIDMALYHDPSTDTSFSFKNMLVSGGIELIVFPAVMRSLYLRASVAWNFVDQINNPGDYYLSPVFPIVPHLPSGDNREIFVGIGHHY